MKNSLRIILFSLILMLSSCSHFLYEELAHIHKGMDIKEVKAVIDSKQYGEGVSLINDEIEKDLFSTDKNMKYLVTDYFKSTGKEYYVFLFQENNLIFWGFPYQFVNNPNLDIRNITTDISKTLKERYID